MKKLLSVISVMTLLALAACSGVPQGQVAQTPADVAARVCPPVQVALVSLQALAGLPLEAQANLAAATPIVAAVCSSKGVIGTADLQTMASQALPILLQVARASGLEVAEQNQIVLGISAAQIVLASVIATLPPPGTK
ncbi:hypothetical protein [Undibacterium sp.]|uniref:hypothetical protein n=1 Tax=Undibacterium sp. TaxID=1914977 RepID=UPI00374D155A